MTESHVTHSSFSLVRHYAVPVERVFRAWSTPASKAKWFTAVGSEHSLDFRVGGRESATGRGPDGQNLIFESVYHGILPNHRIVYASTLSADEEVVTLSVTTVEFQSESGGTRLIITESAAYLDRHELPEWREQGTAAQLEELGNVLSAPAIEGSKVPDQHIS